MSETTPSNHYNPTTGGRVATEKVSTTSPDVVYDPAYNGEVKHRAGLRLGKNKKAKWVPVINK